MVTGALGGKTDVQIAANTLHLMLLKRLVSIGRHGEDKNTAEHAMLGAL